MTARVRTVTVLATAVLGLAPAAALAETGGGGSSGDAPGQAQAAENCVAVYSDYQETVRAGGGPKSGPSSGPVGDYPEGSGPTNCDHFWQAQLAIGNGG